jgi:RNA polymerase sigma-70 factor (ECF subfamily)
MGEADGAAAQKRRYAEAVETLGSALERLARAYERDSEKRRDLLQEIHVSLWRSLARFDGRCSLRTWVYRVAHNTATSKTVRPQINAPVLVSIEASQGPGGDSLSHEEGLDRRRALERVHELIRQLKPLDRQVMLLYLEQLDAVAIGEVTGLSAANVATKVSRLKRLLVQRFHEGKDHEQSS